MTLNIKYDKEREREREMLHIHTLFVRTQFTFRQRRLSLGRCEHKLDAPCPLHADHLLLPTCNYGRFHRALKSVARSWQYVYRSRVACRSRSAISAQILYPDVGDLSKTPSPAVKIHTQDIDLTDRYSDKKTHAEHLFRLYKCLDTFLRLYICSFSDSYYQIFFNIF